MLIGILQTGYVNDALVGEFGDYPEMFVRLLDGHGFTFRTWRVVDMEFPPDVHAADGWLITGSKHGAYEDLPFIKPLEAFIRKTYDAEVPLVGICFGHQIIAQAMGGKVEKTSRGWAVGAKDYLFGDERLTLNAWHQDQVTELPKGVKVIATNDRCENAAMVYGDRILTMQPHPEIRNDYLIGMMEKRGPGVVPEAELTASAERIGTPLDDNLIADRIAAFFKQPRKTRA